MYDTTNPMCVGIFNESYICLLRKLNFLLGIFRLGLKEF